MRILLVEDEPDLGAAIANRLRQEKYVVDWAKDGAEAWNYLENQWTQYTVGIFDWMLPRLSGLELCKKLRSQKSTLPILMLTAKDSIEDRVIGLDAGADDYLVKPFGMVELLARLRALQRRSPQLQAIQLKVGNLTLDYNRASVTSEDINGKSTQVSLTAKEFQLLEYFMQHPNQIISRDQILYQLWEIQSEPESNVVAAQMRLLRRKLADSNCLLSIETIYGLGYRLNEANEPK
ncbi:MAG: two-component system response regulator RppA [Pseudanabaena sp. ELA748]